MLVTYEGVSTLRTRSCRDGLEATRRFVRAVAGEAAAGDLSGELALGDGARVDATFAARALAAMTTNGFAAARVRTITASTREHRFVVPGPELSRAAALVDSLAPIPTAGPVSPAARLDLSIKPLVLVDEQGRPWPRQSTRAFGRTPYDGYGRMLGVSQTYARLSTKTTLSVFLNLPDEDEPSRAAWVARIARVTPLAFSRTGWKRWHRATSGTWIAKKIAPAQVG